jgi:hypothetical protein
MSRAHTLRVAALAVAVLGLIAAAAHAAEPAAEPATELSTAPWLTDVTDAAGIDFLHVTGGTGRKYLPETMGAGGAVLDVDGDGWMDLYFVQSGALPGDPAATAAMAAARDELWRNRGDGTFERVPLGADTPGEYGQGAVAGDLDGDGDTDLYRTAFGPNALLVNGGDGRLRPLAAAGGAEDASWSSSAVLFDPDRDGDLDLYVVNYLDYSLASHQDCRQVEKGFLFYCHPDVYPAAADRFFRNLGTDSTGQPRLEEATGAGGLVAPHGKGLGGLSADFDDDGWPDLYVTNDSTPNFLFHNRGPSPGGDGVHFEEVGLFWGTAYNAAGKTEAGMGVDAGDVNGDGALDLIVTNLSMESNALYLGAGAGQFFEHATATAGLTAGSLPVLGFGTDLADLDNDGDLDLVVINGDVLDNIEQFNDGLTWRQPGQLFANDGQGRFEQLPAAATGPLAEPRVGRGSMTLDFDNDGALDLAVSYNGDRARLYRNQRGGSWIGIELIGAGAIGARVTVQAGGRRQLAEIHAGSSYQSSGDPRLHFGLEPAHAADSVTVRWPDGAVRRLLGVPASRYLRIER